MKVTIETLEKLNACKPGLDLFRARFGEEADRKDVLVVAVEAGKYVDWVIEKLYSDVPLEAKVRAAIRCTLVVYSDTSFSKWANAWLDGSDRTYAAADAAWAAAVAASDAAAEAARAAVAAADAAAWADAAGAVCAAAWADAAGAVWAVKACAAAWAEAAEEAAWAEAAEAAWAANTEQKAEITRILVEELEGDKNGENRTEII